MEFKDVVGRRRMVRRFDQRPVPPVIVDEILDLARRSPTAGFAQGVDFLVLDTIEAIGDFWRLTEDQEHRHDPAEIDVGPTVVILPIADKRRYLARYSEPDKSPFGLEDEMAWPVPFWEVDASMAAMTVLLAAVDAGLGGWLFGITSGEQQVLDHFGVPDGIRPIGVIGLGYRAADERPTGSGSVRERRSLEDQIHRNKW